MPALRVLFLTSGPNVPSTRFRILPYLPRLRAQGLKCDVFHSAPPKYHEYPLLGWRLNQKLRKWMRQRDLVLARLRSYDVIVLERELFDDPSWNVEAAFRQSTSRFLLDVDDAIFLRYPEKFARIAGMADQVLAGNSLLAEKCAEYCSQVSVFPTAVDLAEYAFPIPQEARSSLDVPIIGWIGTPSNLPYLNVALPALKEFARRRRFVLRIITSHAEDLKQVDFQEVPVEFRCWSAKTAVREIQQFSIGIMPLPDEPWERYKCGFKLLQYMAAGVPAIASPVGVNRDIITPGIHGCRAESTEDWLNQLTFLLDNPVQTLAMVQAARQKVEEQYSIDVLAPKLLAAIASDSECKRS
ncbi:MAG: glycosyltransferase family 4 protein [Planctomycetaceae bacterium]|nr:glycosyltransferase family 4 protein [Planctomycetaceae bacterium]